MQAHDDVIKCKHFPRYWPFVRGIHRSPVNSPHKGQWRGALMYSLICAWINDWINNREAGDLRRHRAHYDAIVMQDVELYDDWLAMYANCSQWNITVLYPQLEQYSFQCYSARGKPKILQELWATVNPNQSSSCCFADIVTPTEEAGNQQPNCRQLNGLI